MGQSTCVKCGECMVSCPTSAITFKPVAQVKHLAQGRSAKALEHERADFPTQSLPGIPPKFLLWQAGLVGLTKRKGRPGLMSSGGSL